MRAEPIYGKREIVYRNQHQTVYRVRTHTPEGARDLYVTDYGSRAGVVMHGPDGILLTRQHRYLIKHPSWEIPGGRVNADESQEDAARRECLEETGIRCGVLQPLLMFHPGLDTLHNPTYLFHTSEFEVTDVRSSHPDEVMECVWIPLDQCQEMILSGSILDSISIVAILAYIQRVERPNA